MTDQTPTGMPIVVNADPMQEQITAGLRQAILVFGPLVAFIAQTPLGQKIGLGGIWSAFVSSASAIATITAIIVGQIKTREISQKAATMATILPNSVATTK